MQFLTLGGIQKHMAYLLGEYFVNELTQPMYNSNRNVTMDNWFTSVSLTTELLKSPYKLTITGTLRTNKRHTS